MTTLVLDHLAALPALVRSVRVFLSRLGNAIDEAVSALAERKVSQMQIEDVVLHVDPRNNR